MAKQKFSLGSKYASAEVEAKLLAKILEDPEENFYLVDAIAPVDAWYYYQLSYKQLEDAVINGKPVPDLSDVIAEHQPNAEDDIEVLAQKLRDMYGWREIARVQEEAAKDLDKGVPAKEVMVKMEKRLTDIQSTFRELQLGQTVQATSLIQEVLEDVEKRYQVMQDTKSTVVGLPTGFVKLDGLLGGLQEGIHLLAAEPGQGKSTIALQIARNVAAQGFPVLFISFEETLRRLMLKNLCALGKKELKRYTDGFGSSAELAPIVAEYRSKLQHLYFVQGNKELTVSKVKAKAKQLMNKTGKDRCLIIIDYLQRWAAHMRGSASTDFRHTVRDLTADIRDLALTLNSPVIVISSQNRTGQGQARLTSLKESGDLEYDADSAIFLTKPSKKKAKFFGDDSSHVVLHLEKNRYGSKRKINYRFYGGMAYFEELDFVPLEDEDAYEDDDSSTYKSKGKSKNSDDLTDLF